MVVDYIPSQYNINAGTFRTKSSVTIKTEKYKLDSCGGIYGAPEGTRKLKSFEWLDCTNNKVLNVAIAQTIKF